MGKAEAKLDVLFRATGAKHAVGLCQENPEERHSL